MLKRETDRVALLDAVVSGDPRFFLGTDSAPHARRTKEQACGCAGIYSAHAALELYAEVFEEAGALHRLEAFASEFGPQFYGLPLNEGLITLSRRELDCARELSLRPGCGRAHAGRRAAALARRSSVSHGPRN